MSEKTPSAAIVGGAKPTEVLKDDAGRSLAIRKLNALENAKIGRAVGSDAATNQYYMTYALVAAMVRSIDGEPLMFPKTAEHVEAAIDLLDDHGIAAVMDWAALQAKADGVVETAKN